MALTPLITHCHVVSFSGGKSCEARYILTFRFFFSASKPNSGELYFGFLLSAKTYGGKINA